MPKLIEFLDAFICYKKNVMWRRLLWPILYPLSRKFRNIKSEVTSVGVHQSCYKRRQKVEFETENRQRLKKFTDFKTFRPEVGIYG